MLAKLTCPNCGATLQLTEDIERFACAYCGAGLVQERRGGAVILRSLAETLRKVQHSTETTAIELAIQRHRATIKDLALKRTKLSDESRDNAPLNDGVFGICIGVGAVTAMVTGNVTVGLIAGGLLCVLSFVGGLMSSADRSRQMSAIDQDIAALEARIKDKERLVDP